MDLIDLCLAFEVSDAAGKFNSLDVAPIGEPEFFSGAVEEVLAGDIESTKGGDILVSEIGVAGEFGVIGVALLLDGVGAENLLLVIVGRFLGFGDTYFFYVEVDVEAV